jgi:hypothetical protein
MPEGPVREFLVRVRAKPDPVPAAVRLRRWLKLGLRGFGMRAVAVEKLPAGPEATEAATDSAPHGLGEA